MRKRYGKYPKITPSQKDDSETIIPSQNFICRTSPVSQLMALKMPISRFFSALILAILSQTKISKARTATASMAIMMPLIKAEWFTDFFAKPGNNCWSVSIRPFYGSCIEPETIKAPAPWNDSPDTYSLLLRKEFMTNAIGIFTYRFFIIMI
jgi:hypothetical protein